jgi:hypothetical protein
VSCRGARPEATASIETGWVERGSLWRPSDSEEDGSGEVVGGSADERLSELDFRSGSRSGE